MPSIYQEEVVSRPGLAHVVTFTGPFGFIKPWTAVRDELTQSQQFLTPSIVEGMRLKLGVSGILRHRLSYAGMAEQQEVVQSSGMRIRRTRRSYTGRRGRGIITRRVMIYPTLHLAFQSSMDADIAASQTLCLCRNEDLVFPVRQRDMEWTDFEQLDGFELLFEKTESSILVGYNRYEDGAPMYGTLQMVGSPVRAPREARP